MIPSEWVIAIALLAWIALCYASLRVVNTLGDDPQTLGCLWIGLSIFAALIVYFFAKGAMRWTF